MVIDIIFRFVYSVVSTLLSPLTTLADASLPDNVSNAFIQARGFLHALDFVLPYTTLFAVIGLIVSIEAGILVYKIVYWLIKRIPTQS